MLRITDYERISLVTPTQLGEFFCPKCNGLCREVSPEKRIGNKRQFDCTKCFRGWIEVSPDITTIAQALADE